MASATTLADIEAGVRDDTNDLDSANYGNDQATVWRIANKCLVTLKGITDDRVYPLSATASGCTQASGNSSQTTLTPVNIRRILAIYPAAAVGSVVPISNRKSLDRWERWELNAMHNEDSVGWDDASVGATHASAYACWRLGTATAGSVGKWNVGFWRLNFNTTAPNYFMEVLQEPAPMTGGTDRPDASDIEIYAIRDMTSAICARFLGHSEERIADLKSRVPVGLQAALALVEREVGIVRPRPAEEPS